MKNLTSYLFKSNIAGALRLLQNGADINANYDVGTRPITSAINSDNPKMLEFVIAQGADAH